MTAPTTRWRAALTLAPLSFLLLSSAAARAQEDPFAADEVAPAKPTKPTEGAKGREHESLTAPRPTEPAEPPPVGPVERLPPTAYPEWTVRGITGGSLWFSGSFHGMPWPYYPKTGIGVSGYAWLDTGYEKIDRGNITEPDSRFLVSQGRAVLRVTPTYSLGTFYLQGQVELVGNKDQAQAQPNVADIDDLWLRFGQWKQWDVEVGRYEAFEVYHFGMGLDLNTLERDGASDRVRGAPDVYGLRSVTYRQSGVGNIAFHGYLSNFVRFEMLGQFGFDSQTTLDTVGARPAVVVDFGWLKLKAEGDVRKQFAVDFSVSKESRFQRGGSGSVQIVLDPYAELGANVAYGLVDHYLPTNPADPNASMGAFDGIGSVTDTSFGGFANVRLIPGVIVGGGANFTKEVDQVNGEFTHLQGFGALQYVIAKQLFVKFVGAYAKAHLAPGTGQPWDNTMLSGRLRLMYLF